jgi:hypothetical protein
MVPHFQNLLLVVLARSVAQQNEEIDMTEGGDMDPTRALGPGVAPVSLELRASVAWPEIGAVRANHQSPRVPPGVLVGEAQPFAVPVLASPGLGRRRRDTRLGAAGADPLDLSESCMTALHGNGYARGASPVFCGFCR